MKNHTSDKTPLSRFSSRTILVLLLLPCLYLLSRQPVTGQQEPHLPPDSGSPNAALQFRLNEISAGLQPDETVPVIIRLRAPFSAATEVAGGARAAVQRRGIEAARARLLARIALRNPDSLKTFRVLPLVGLAIDRAGLEALRGSAELLDITLDQPNQRALTDALPSAATTVDRLTGDDGTGQTVALLDSGVDASHPALQNKLGAEACFSTTDPRQLTTSLCPNQQSAAVGAGAGLNCDPSIESCSRGTSLAGVIAGRGPGYTGVAPGAGLISIQIFSRFEGESNCGPGRPFCIYAYDSDVIRALEHVYLIREDHSIAAVNLALVRSFLTYRLSCDGIQPAIESAIDLLATVGIPVIAPAGITGSDTGIAYPACVSNVVSVGVSIDQDRLAGFTDRAFFLNLLAPGVDINSPRPGGGFGRATGGDLSVAHVAGAWAILRQRRPLATPNEILTAMIRGGRMVIDSPTGLSYPILQIEAARREIDLIKSPGQAPINLSAVVLPINLVDLRWVDRATNETGFRIFRKMLSGEDWIEIGRVGADQTGFIDDKLPIRGIYAYRVQAIFPDGESLLSHQVSVLSTGPSVPPPIELQAETISSRRVDLSWTLDPLPGDRVIIDRRNMEINFTDKIELRTGARGYSDTRLVPGRSYRYTVFIRRAGGESFFSNTVTVTTLARDVEVATDDGREQIDFGTVRATSDPASPQLTRTARLKNVTRQPIQIGLVPLDWPDPREAIFGTHYYNFPYSVTDPATGVTRAGEPKDLFTIDPGDERVLTIQLNRRLPRPFDFSRGFPADLLPPRLKTNLVVYNREYPYASDSIFEITARIETAAQLTNPVEPSQRPLVTFRRDGKGIEVGFSIYDPNLDASLVTYQFYDQIGRPVGRPVSYLPGPSLRTGRELPGMALNITRRFTNLERFNDLRSVRVTIYDSEGSASAVSIPVADVGSAQPR